jgi:predicted anti-sigma-YlaC factor YlaD
MRWMPTCKQATELASREMDEHLPMLDRLGLQMHLAICKNCRRFTAQLEEMRRLFRLETGADDEAVGLDPDARRRIETELQKKLDA